MAIKVITDKKEAGKFAQQVIEQNIANFTKLETPKAAYGYFKEHYAQVNLTYDNFWYHLKTVKARLGLTDAPKAAKPATVAADGNLTMPDVVFETLPEIEATEVEIKIYDPHKETVNEEIFQPYTTGKHKDFVVSKTGGFMPGTTIVYTGGPSVGKTTVALDDLHNACLQFVHTIKKAADRKVAESEFVYLSSEMKRIDLQAEQKEKVWMRDIKSVLMNEYPKNQYKVLVEKVICHGYRMLVIDSFQNIVERLVTFCHMTTSSAATFLLNCIEKANSGETTTGHNTCILLIQQVTKGGVFVGKNNLKHDTTAMLEFKFDDTKANRYCEFTKNRRNGGMLYKKLFYNLNEANEVTYDEQKWNEDREREAIIKREKNSMDESREEFEAIFKNNPQQEGEDDEEM